MAMASSSATAAVAMAGAPLPTSSSSAHNHSSSLLLPLHRHSHVAFASRRRLPSRRPCMITTPAGGNPSPNYVMVRAMDGDGPNSSATGALADSVVPQVALLEEEPDTPGVAPASNQQVRKPSPLARGGTLSGDQAAGKDPSLSALGKSNTRISTSMSGPFADPRWKNGTWDIQQFSCDGKVDWDAVIDAEVIRRKWLEENPEASRNEDPVVFDTSTIPWWAWVKRFHLPEAELLNGRAAMIGFFMGYVVDSLTGVGLVDQTSSFFGKFFLLISVLGVLFIRKNEDFENLKQLVKEWNFYDKQWQATWQDEQASSSKSEK